MSNERWIITESCVRLVWWTQAFAFVLAKVGGEWRIDAGYTPG
jgi:hypothetical protein